MRGGWRSSVVLAGLLACNGGSDTEPIETDAEESDDSDVETETDTHETDHSLPDDTENFRPLCLEIRQPVPVAADLTAWAAATRNSNNRFFGETEWQALEAAGESLGPTADRQVQNRLLRGWYRLRFGDFPGAVSDLEAAEALAISDVPQWRGRARQLLGLVWMRAAETQNCITNGSGHACIIPFNEHGEHDDPTGMQNAAAALLRALEEDLPTALSPRWLYNVTFMARGLWPEEVVPEWLIGEDFLVSEGPIAAWENVAPSVGIKTATLAGGSSLNDVDGDGLLDLVMSSMEIDAGMELFLNMGDGRFCDASVQSGLTAITGILDFKLADYDNDGDLDILAPRAAWMRLQGTVRPSLLRNDGQGHFEDVAVAAGITGAQVNGPTQVGVWGDVNNDGLLDIFMGREDDEDSPIARRSSSLYINQGDGTFLDVAPSAGVVSAGFVKGATFIDYDEDGDLDLYVSSLRGRDRFFRNNGNLTFTDVAQSIGVLDPVKSFPAATVDYDQDGHLDLLVAAFTNNYAGGGPLDPTYFQSMESYLQSKMGLPIDPLFSETAHLYKGDGAGGFEDVTVAVGLDDVHATMGLSVGDFDMDGFPDFYFATGAPEFDALEPNTSYHNVAGTAFLDVTSDMRTGQIQKGHGVSFGDVDEDGDEDIYVEMGGAFRGDPSPSAFFVNPTNALGNVQRHAVTLQLEGVTVNRSAIGAKVAVVTPGRTFYHLVGQTGSFGGNSLQVEVALGDETEITRVEIRWPGAALETLTAVPIDSIVSIRQGEGVVASRAFRTFEMAHEDH